MAVFIDDLYAYSTTSSGIVILDITTESPYYYINVPAYCHCIYSDNTYIFIGTNNGIYRAHRDAPQEIYRYLYYPFISSDIVEEIKGNNDFLVISTVSGINIERRQVGYVTKNVYVKTKSCVVTPTTNQVYYVVYESGSNYCNISRLDSNSSDWSTADVTYEQSESFISGTTAVNSIAVTEKTSTDEYNNTIFAATSNGVIIYDEGTADYMTISGIGNNSNYTSIMVSNGSSLNDGIIYLTSSGITDEFVIFNISENSIVDLYSYNASGKSGEYLLSNEIDSFYSIR